MPALALLETETAKLVVITSYAIAEGTDLLLLIYGYSAREYCTSGTLREANEHYQCPPLSGIKVGESRFQGMETCPM